MRFCPNIAKLLAACVACCALADFEDLYGQEKYAFIVGVENYDPEFFRNLDYAEDDAIALAAQLESMEYQVSLMTSQQRNPQHKPNTPTKILRMLDGVLQGIQSDDTLVISFSGHGIQFSDDEDLEGGGKETWFVPEEGSLEDKETLLPLVEEIVSRVDDCKAERKLVLIDACRNEVLSPAGDKSSRKIDLGSVHENPQVVPKGMTVVFSCTSGQKSWETDDLKHSVFSNFVLEYLSGRLDEDFYDDKNATVGGMVDYVQRKTKQYVINNITASGQYPRVIGDNEQWPIGSVGPRVSLINSLDMQLRMIPAGKFQMGSPEDEVHRKGNEYLHEVEITRPFYLGVHEVTREQFARFVEDSGRDMSGVSFGFSESKQRVDPGDQYSFDNPGWEQDADHPATCISWQDAVAFCEWLSRKEGATYRLPTEAEWEYACRAGSSKSHSFGNESADKFCNITEDENWKGLEDIADGFEFTSPVGSFEPNEFGLCDMHGNVNEWVSDFYRKDYYQNSPPADPQGPSDGDQRILRGGSFNKTQKSTRSAERLWMGSDQRFYANGFRVVCEIK